MNHFKILVLFWFTTSKVIHDIYYKEHFFRAVPQVATLLSTNKNGCQSFLVLSNFTWFLDIVLMSLSMTQCEMCPYSEFFWCVFSCICTEYGKIRSISPYSVRMWESTDQKNFEYRHFSYSAIKGYEIKIWCK